MHFSVRPLFDFLEEMYSRNHSAIAITRNKRYRKTSANYKPRGIMRTVTQLRQDRDATEAGS